MKLGSPMVNQAVIVTWRGRNGYGSAPSPISPGMPTRKASSTEYTVLVRNSTATRSMFPITRRPR